MTEAGGRGGQTPGDDREDAAELRGHEDEQVSEETPEQFVDDARRYRLDARIATGGMGEVWRGTDTVLGREVAVKLLKTEYADNPTFRSRFETEARHAASLHHGGVAAVYDFGEAEPTDGSDVHRPYLVMELVDGQPLSALLLPDRPLDPDVTRDLLAQAAAALGAAHAAGIVHRDVKPANLLVTPDRTVKITDFGIARAADGIGLTDTGQVMGTPQYLSPEQAQGGTATPASDVYSLGVVAFECLAGQRPYVAESAVATALAHLRDPVPDLPAPVPADLAAVVRKAMAKKPEERYADGDAFAEALRDPASAAAAAAAGGAAAAEAYDEPATERTQVLGGAAAGAAGAAGLAAAAPVAAPATPATGTPAQGTPAPAGRRTPWGWILLALLVVAAIVVVAVLASGNDDTPTDEPEQPTISQDTRDPEPTRSEEPTEEPTTEEPSQTQEPSEEPSSESPSETPSETPTATEEPTETPTEEPTETPTESPATQESSEPTTTLPPSPTGSGRPSPEDEETA